MLKAWWPARRPDNDYGEACTPATVTGNLCRYRFCHTPLQMPNPDNYDHVCLVWSCRFSDSFSDIINPLSCSLSCCMLCKILVLHKDTESYGQQHRYRECDQHCYTSASEFTAHLSYFHGAQVSGSNVEARLGA